MRFYMYEALAVTALVRWATRKIDSHDPVFVADSYLPTLIRMTVALRGRSHGKSLSKNL
jgi:hypothetical protein